MNIPPINLKAQFKGVKKDILRGIRETLDDQKLILGQYCLKLEEQISSMTGAAHAVSCANGTDALILSLMALGIGHGDEVVTTPYTFFSTASSIALVGARPVFADIQESDMNIDPSLIEQAITPKTKAILVVHLFGKICDMKRILSIAGKRGIPVIEDMAQALGARRGGLAAGTFGDIAATSFYPTKNLGGIGEGGMVLTRRSDLGDKTRKLRVHGMGEKQYIHEMIGFNSRLDEIKALALSVKFTKLASWNKTRLETAGYYNMHMRNLPLTLPTIDDETSHIFHHYVVRTDRRDALQLHLRERGIITGIYYPLPLHMQPCFSYLGVKEGDFPVAERAAKTSLAIPVFPELKKKEKDYIIESIRSFFDK
ncbi:MAG: DegT/DnrJ/EryC1/StrS family aminotransferase [Syntrophorhabdaceae bacterium]|nr:DegT/DnrJ/EryC1/StrS family aminotransferase [Syntrophorhabdaceae bacterium]